MPAHLSSVSMLIVTRGVLDLHTSLVECLRDAFGDEYAEPPGDDQLRGMIAVTWSRPLSKDNARTLHRITFTPDRVDEDDGGDDNASSDKLIRDFCTALRGLVNDDDPGIAHVVRFASPAQFRQLEALYREIYEIEMRLREVLTFIFLDEYPDRAYDLLRGNAVRPQNGGGQLTDEYLKAHDENHLFYILFEEYDDLNQNPVAKPTDLLPLIREKGSYDDLRQAVSDSPIRRDRAVGFLSALKELISSIEAVRNAVAHNRDVSNRAIVNYHEARPRVLRLIDEFWQAELDDRVPQAGANAPVLPIPELETGLEPEPTKTATASATRKNDVHEPPHLAG